MDIPKTKCNINNKMWGKHGYMPKSSCVKSNIAVFKDKSSLTSLYSHKPLSLALLSYLLVFTKMSFAQNVAGERNQFSKKMKALNRLKAKLLVILKDQGVSNVTRIKNEAIINHWHQETRRYVFHPYKLVQDVKTGIQLADPNFVLNGNLDPFISAHIHNRHACDM